MNVIFFQHLADGTISRTLNSYGTQDLALTALYGGMRASIGDTNIIKVIGEMVDDEGFIVKSEIYVRETEESTDI